MRLRPAIAALLSAMAPVSCAFLLDFDELQKGDNSPAQDAGDDGAQCNCVTTDPCRPQLCQQGQCVESPIKGLAPDGYDAVFTTEESYRVTLTSFGNAFYGSLFSKGPAQDELRFFKVGFDEKPAAGQPPLSKLTSQLTGGLATLADLMTAVPASAAGLSASSLMLNAAFATTTGQVFQLKLNDNLEPQLGSGPAGPTAPYLIGERYRHPHTWVSGGKAFVGWITTSKNIHVVGNPTPDVFGSGNVTSFAPLITPGGAAVAWLENGAYIKHQDQASPISIPGCENTASWQYFVMSSFAIGLAADVSNVVVWSKTDGTNWDAHSKTVFCGANTCIPSPSEIKCSDPGTVSGIRNISALAFTVPAQQAGFVYEVVAYSVQSSAGRQINLSAIELNIQNGTVTELGSLVALTQIEPVDRAGDWPALAFSGLDKVLVGWIHPRADAPDEAHLRRYKLCL